MYVILICVSSRILALSDFFFDSVKFGNTWCVVRCCPRSPSCLPFQPSFVPQLRQLCTPSTLFLRPLPRPCHSIHGHLRTTSTPRRTPTVTTYLANRQPYPPASQIRARKDPIRRPTLHPYPNRRHSLSAPNPLLRPPLALCVHFQESS
jgi:hypothetical protein